MLFYLRIRGRRGRKIAIVATARKLLGIIWHLLITGEEYIDKHYIKKTIKNQEGKHLKDVMPVFALIERGGRGFS